VGHHDDGHAAIVERFEELEDRLTGLRVEISRRLVGHDHGGVGHQSPGDRHALLLTAGELLGTVPEAIFETHLGESRLRAGPSLGLAAALIEERHLDVLDDGEFADQVEGLKDEADAAPADAAQFVVGESGDVVAIEEIPPGGRAIEAAEQVHQRRLAASRRPHDGDVLAVFDPQIEAAERFDEHASVGLVVHLGEALKLRRGEHGGGGGWRGGEGTHSGRWYGCRATPEWRSSILTAVTLPDRETFRALARSCTVVPIVRRLMSDQITPVLAYRRLVSADERTAPSFLFESVENGARAGRYSMLGAQPSLEVMARESLLTVIDHRRGTREVREVADPLAVPAALLAAARPLPRALRGRVGLPHCFCGGWVGYAGYDTVRYLEPSKLPFSAAPPDDRGLADLHFGLYCEVVVIDHVDKLTYAIVQVSTDDFGVDSAETEARRDAALDAAYDAGRAALAALVRRLETHSVPLPGGEIALDLAARPATPSVSNFEQSSFEEAVRKAKEYIAAGDAFQVVLSQRLERVTEADPFEIYRALRIVNPSPYQIYLQTPGAILVASSPEILCRVHGGVVTNRPLAGTRRRGVTDAEDRQLEVELLADEKERAEHVMLVDLGRNDLGQVCTIGSIAIERCMDVERYSHVMHISSTLTGTLRGELSAWDALRATLPVGTVSGAPKVRAMQIIDELEPSRRGPYAGGIGCVGFDGEMDIALALRTLVVPTEQPNPTADPTRNLGTRRLWRVHLQAGAGVVADSDPSREYEETITKAAALGRAIDLAEATFRPASAATGNASLA